MMETDNHDAAELIEEELERLYDRQDNKMYMITIEEVEKLWG